MKTGDRKTDRKKRQTGRIQWMKIYLAPLEGITGHIYRTALKECFDGFDKYFIPFISPNQKGHFSTREKKDVLPENNRGVLAVPQILTNRAGDFLLASKKLAEMGYREINLRAMKLIKDGGYLATCSCSHFMTYELFTKTIGQAAANVHKRLRQVSFATQAPDHPILWAADTSYYLKFYIFQVCDEK